jgi:thiol-disulfide isomerase/thioredoxin
MTCPKCRLYTPDNAWRCGNCGAVLSAAQSPLRSPGDAPRQGPRRIPWGTALVAIVLIFLMAWLYLGRSTGASHGANHASPGETLELTSYLRMGKVNIVDFYSDYCPPCRRLAPLLEKLGAARPGIAVIKLDINRRGVKGIDWRSPLARQYDLRSIPRFQVWDEQGKLLHDGDGATSFVMDLLARERIVE